MFNVVKTLVFALVASCAAQTVTAAEWDVVDLNDHVNQTNFIVNDNCSGTLLSVEHRIILTNHHCISNSVRHQVEKVTDANGFVVERNVEIRDPVKVSQKQYENHKLVTHATFVTEIVDFSEEWDLALLQMRADSIPNTREAKLFSGDMVYRGETVYAIGNPLMLDATVTKGVVSNTNRLLRVGRKEHPYYQMDSGIAGGSSGGSLYNANGELIGVPAASARGTSVGLAIPYTFVQKLLERNCYQELYEEEADSYEVCINDEED